MPLACPEGGRSEWLRTRLRVRWPSRICGSATMSSLTRSTTARRLGRPGVLRPREQVHSSNSDLVTSDVKEHQWRLNGRDRGLVHVGEPSWSDVQRRRTEYASWSDEVLEFDAAVRGVDDIAGVLATRLSKT